MKQKLIFAIAVIFSVSFFGAGCKEDSENKPFQEKRDIVSTEPVKTFSESGTGVNTGTLTVKLYETENSLNYKMVSEYNQKTWDYLLTFPNLGIMPRPELKRVDTAFGCQVGFYDPDGNFREFRMVLVEDNTMYFKRLKEYQVTPLK